MYVGISVSYVRNCIADHALLPLLVISHYCDRLLFVNHLLCTIRLLKHALTLKYSDHIRALPIQTLEYLVYP